MRWSRTERSKNHYGSKSRRGTAVAATFYTVLETAKLHGVITLARGLERLAIYVRAMHDFYARTKKSGKNARK